MAHILSMETNNQFTLVHAEDVKKYGIIRATILGKIKGWCETNQKNKRYEYDGYFWSGHLTIQEISETTGLPLETVKKNLKWLLNNQVIIKGNYNKFKRDRTGWYRPNPTVLSDTFHCSSQNPSIVPLRNLPLFLSDPFHCSSQERTLPNNPTNIPTNNQKTNNPTNIPTNMQIIKELKPVIVERVCEDAGYLFELYFQNSLTPTQINKFKNFIPTILELVPATKKLNLPVYE